ncbi:EAL domain-containing protein [Paraburkholderia sp. BR14263]|uniref:EAL domain-containing protein n=1 Tax=unclassified Paraburkholderia TaxID=2615204 RepID=UPI0034CF3399
MVDEKNSRNVSGAGAEEDEACPAQEVWDALRDNRFTLTLEPVSSVDDANNVLYHECFAVLIDAQGVSHRAGSVVPALREAGLIRLFDRYVARSAIRLLKSEPQLRLGVNLSGFSAVPDVLWTAAFLDLAQRPDVARRLVVEITESEPLRTGDARLFGRQVRALGCRLAIDDLGAGHSFDNLDEFEQIDIVKIDRSILVGARAAQGETRLKQLVSLASHVATQVVVEGVETEADVAVVRAAGATWMQGRLLTAAQH